jgi:hypothetical protein
VWFTLDKAAQSGPAEQYSIIQNNPAWTEEQRTFADLLLIRWNGATNKGLHTQQKVTSTTCKSIPLQDGEV